MTQVGNPLDRLIGNQVVASTPWHVTVGLLTAISGGYLIVTDAFRFHSDDPAKRRAFTLHVCGRKTDFQPTHRELYLSLASIHTIFLVSSVDWEKLDEFETAILNVRS